MPEDGLALQLGISRAPVREALVELEQEGLVAFDHRGRSRVRNFTEEDFEAVFSMRCTLEVMAARLVTARVLEVDGHWNEALNLYDEVGRARYGVQLMEIVWNHPQVDQPLI